MLYGNPGTHDIDLCFSSRRRRPSVVSHLSPPQFYVPPSAVIVQEMARERRGHFNIVHADSGLKADFTLLDAMNCTPGLSAMFGAMPLAKTPSRSRRRNTSFSESWNTTAKAVPKSICAYRSMLAVSGDLLIARLAGLGCKARFENRMAARDRMR